MSNKMLLTTKLSQKLAMNPQLSQVITLLQYTTLELKQEISNILEKNPLIEVVEEDGSESEADAEDLSWHNGSYISSRNSYSREQPSDDQLENVAIKESLRDYLINQTLNCHFDDTRQLLAEAIIDAIDENGYLSMTLNEILAVIPKDDGVNISLLEQVLKAVQQFDPPGIGARNTQECLSLQIERIETKTDKHIFAQKIVATNALDMERFDLKQLVKITGLAEKEVTEGLKFLKTLDFHPAQYFTSQDLVMDPELYVKKVNNKWKAYLSNSILTRLDVNKQYKTLIKQHSRDKSYKSVLSQLQEAQLLINGIKRRNDTLLSVANYIVEIQAGFFDEGKSELKPMTMSEVAAQLDCHESTISRVTTGKYIATPHGILELKYFFPSHIKTTNGDNKSSTAVKLLIEQLINQEDPGNVYSDDQIAVILKEQDIHISRRTVAKYREEMNIPSSYLRAGMNMIRKTINQEEEADCLPA